MYTLFFLIYLNYTGPASADPRVCCSPTVLWVLPAVPMSGAMHMVFARMTMPMHESKDGFWYNLGLDLVLPPQHCESQFVRGRYSLTCRSTSGAREQLCRQLLAAVQQQRLRSPAACRWIHVRRSFCTISTETAARWISSFASTCTAATETRDQTEFVW